MKKLFLFFFIFVLVIGSVSSLTFFDFNTGEESWIEDTGLFSGFSTVTSQQCSLKDGTTYTRYDGQCRERFDCKPTSNLQSCSCSVKPCDSSSQTPGSDDSNRLVCQKTGNNLYIDGEKVREDFCNQDDRWQIYTCDSSSSSGFKITATSEDCSTLKSCADLGGFRTTSQCQSFNTLSTLYEQVSAKGDIAGQRCCIPFQQETKDVCVRDSDKKEFDIDEAFCDNDEANVCLLVSGNPRFAVQTCTRFGGCDSATGKCKSTTEQCNLNGQTLKVNTITEDWHCKDNKRIKEAVINIDSNGNCVTGVTGAFLCNFGCEDGVCLDKDGDKPTEEGDESTISEKQTALTADEIKKSTATQIANALCNENSDCNNGNCVSQTFLENEGILTKATFLKKVDEAVTLKGIIKGIARFFSIDLDKQGICFDEEEENGNGLGDIKLGTLGCKFGETLGIKSENACSLGWLVIGGILLLLIFALSGRK